MRPADPLYPKFRLIALVVAVPVAVALLTAQGVGVGVALALGFGFAFAVELTGLHVARCDQRVAAEWAREQAAATERAVVWEEIVTACQEIDGPSRSASLSSPEEAREETPAAPR